jgi:hypothetical protein
MVSAIDSAHVHKHLYIHLIKGRAMNRLGFTGTVTSYENQS